MCSVMIESRSSVREWNKSLLHMHKVNARSLLHCPPWQRPLKESPHSMYQENVVDSCPNQAVRTNWTNQHKAVENSVEVDMYFSTSVWSEIRGVV